MQPTVVPLGDAILNPPPLSQIRDLGPVFIRVRRAAEGAAGIVCGGGGGRDMPRGRSRRVGIALSGHDGGKYAQETRRCSL